MRQQHRARKDGRAAPPHPALHKVARGATKDHVLKQHLQGRRGGCGRGGQAAAQTVPFFQASSSARPAPAHLDVLQALDADHGQAVERPVLAALARLLQEGHLLELLVAAVLTGVHRGRLQQDPRDRELDGLEVVLRKVVLAPGALAAYAQQLRAAHAEVGRGQGEG